VSTDAEKKDRDLIERNRFWSPWSGFDLLNLDRMFKEITHSMMQPFGSFDLSKDWREPFCEMDYNRENDEIRLILEMPGLDKEDIQVNVSDKSVRIKGESENRKYMRSYSFPRNLDPEQTKASFNNGILELTLKMTESDQGYNIKIE
jgi:HSP20 family molecular chaperone IbpA